LLYPVPSENSFQIFLRNLKGKAGDISMAMVKLKDGESFESAFRRFKKQCEKAGILSEVKKREHFEKPSVRLKKKSISARKRALKKSRRTFGE
jgi:small subunit ribosomal protein S21